MQQLLISEILAYDLRYDYKLILKLTIFTNVRAHTHKQLKVKLNTSSAMPSVINPKNCCRGIC